jgi:hypothetical protein
MEKEIILFLLLLWALVCFNNVSSFGNDVDDILNYTQTENDLKFKNHIKQIDDINNDIALEFIGCFTNVYTHFFLRKINPFSLEKDFDSGVTISQKSIITDYEKILNMVKTNGFSSFANSFEKRYSTNYQKVPIQQLAALALFSGYNYISISKFDNENINEIYFSYSPPMDRHNVTGNFTEEEYKKYLSKPNGIKECGFSCGDGSKYYCGSVAHPTIKSPSLYSVYKIIEKV